MEAVKRFLTKLIITIFKVILIDVIDRIIKMVRKKVDEYYERKKKNEKNDEKKRDFEKQKEDVSRIFDDIDKEIPDILKKVSKEQLQRIEDKTIPLDQRLESGDDEDDTEIK